MLAAFCRLSPRPQGLLLRASLRSTPMIRSATPKRFLSGHPSPLPLAGSTTKPSKIPFHRQLWEDVKKYLRNYAIVKVGLVVTAGAAALYFYSKEDIVGRVLTQFERNDIDYRIELKYKVPRPDLVKQLQDLLLRPSTDRKYYVVVGETGTGKTTAVQEAVSTLKDSPRGVVYCMSDDPNNSDSFTRDLAKSVAYDPNMLDLVGGLRRYWSDRSASDANVSSWSALRVVLAEAAERFNEKHGRPLVLVIDAADFIAKRDPAFMKRLQDFAKNSADRGYLRIIFVTSEGSTLPLMMDSSSIKRGKIIEVGDITDDAAVDYLIRRGVPEDRAKDAVKYITGGRMIELNNFAGDWKEYKTNAEYRAPFDDATGKTIDLLGMKEKHPLFKELLEGRIHRRVAGALVVASDPDTASTPEEKALKALKAENKIQVLLAENILAAHVDGTYTFHSRVVETFFRSAQ